MTLYRYVDAYRYRRIQLSHPNAGNIRQVKKRADALWELQANTSHRVYNDWVSGVLMVGVKTSSFTRRILLVPQDEHAVSIKQVKECAVPGKTIRSTTEDIREGNIQNTVSNKLEGRRTLRPS